MWPSPHEDAIEIEWLTPQLEIETHANGVGQDLAHEPRLAVPPITHTATRHGKVRGQLGPHRCDDFAPARTRAYQAERLGQRQTCPRWRNDVQALVRHEDGGLVLGKDAFVCGDAPTGIACHQGREALEVVGAGRQERGRRAQTAPRDAQAEFAPGGMPGWRGTRARIGLPRHTVIPPPPTGIGADGQGQRLHHLERVWGMPALLDAATRHRGLELPEVGGLSHQERALREGGAERPIMDSERGAAVWITRQRAKGTPTDPGHDLDSTQWWHATAVS